MNYDFSNAAVFAELEDKATDGILNYDDFPMPEKEYFKKLTELGYNNRDKDWTPELCMKIMSEYREEYLSKKHGVPQYRVDIRQPKNRALYERYKKWKGIPSWCPLSDDERIEFEDYVTGVKKNG